MSQLYYPIGLDVANKDVLVVGGGTVAEGKVVQLLACQARVRLVNPRTTDALRLLAAEGLIVWEQRLFVAEDVAPGGQPAWIVIAASDDRAANAEVARVARAAGRLANAVDDVPNCDFIAMSLLRRGDLQVSISTGGGSPAMARWLREELEALLPEELGPLLDVLADVRAELKARGPVPPYEAGRAALAGDVMALLRGGERAEARRQLLEALTFTKGIVYLVGAGPGDPGLLTLRGRECLGRADAVVYDHLVDDRLLAFAHPRAKLIFAGKEPGRHYVPQAQTSQMLIDLAGAGQTVVRLKGGDPFVFGRGGEEAAALAAAGVPFEVVPGVSSAIAAPAYAGIPVTHRDHASAFVVVTGHEEPGKRESKVAWDELARSGATLVVLMGLTNLRAIVERVLGAGRAADTPVAVIQNASRPDQRTVLATLADVVERVAEAGIGPPAVIVIGPVARLHDELAWFGVHHDHASRAHVLEEARV